MFKFEFHCSYVIQTVQVKAKRQFSKYTWPLIQIPFLDYFIWIPLDPVLMIFLLNRLWTPVQTNRALGLRGTRGNFGITSPRADPFREPRETGSVPGHRGLAIPLMIKTAFTGGGNKCKAKKPECPMLEYRYRREQSLLTSLSLT